MDTDVTYMIDGRIFFMLRDPLILVDDGARRLHERWSQRPCVEV